MPVITVYPRGAKMGTRSPNGNRIPPKREECKGWTDGATRRNRDWLMSIDGDRLTGTPVAITLTLRDLPPSEEEWVRIRRAMFDRLRRMGLIRLHWVTEWTRRGLPHLHCAAYFDTPSDPTSLAQLAHAVRVGWLELTAAYGTGYQSQHVVPITDAGGWFQYVAKHAARGVKHYQRQRDTLPPGWHKTGRMWGYLGDWPVHDVRLDLDPKGFHALRRLVRSYAVADARARRAAYVARTPGLRRLPLVTKTGAQIGWTWADLEHPDRTHNTDKTMRSSAREIRFSRRLLRVTDRRRAPVVGMSTWIPRPVMGRFLNYLHGEGHVIEADPEEP